MNKGPGYRPRSSRPRRASLVQASTCRNISHAKRPLSAGFAVSMVSPCPHHRYQLADAHPRAEAGVTRLANCCPGRRRRRHLCRARVCARRTARRHLRAGPAADPARQPRERRQDPSGRAVREGSHQPHRRAHDARCARLRGVPVTLDRHRRGHDQASTPFIYAVHEDSMVSADDMRAHFVRCYKTFEELRAASGLNYLDRRTGGAFTTSMRATPKPSSTRAAFPPPS